MKRLIALALLALAACATPVRLDPSLRWSLHHGPGHPTLVYGVPESDAMTVLVLECRPGDDVIHITDPTPDGPDGPIRIGAPPHRVNLAAETTREVDGGYEVTASLPRTHPLLRRFRATGRLELGNADGGAFPIVTDRAERAAITGFFDACDR